MTRIVIQWQDPFGNWHRLQEKHNQGDAFRTAQARARSTGRRHRLVDEQGHMLDLLEHTASGAQQPQPGQQPGP